MHLALWMRCLFRFPGVIYLRNQRGTCQYWRLQWLLMVDLLSLAINTKNKIDRCLNHEMVAVDNMHVTLSTCILDDTGSAVVWPIEVPYNILRKS